MSIIFARFNDILINKKISGIGVALHSKLAPFINGVDLQTDVQPRFVRVLSVPEYYAE
jgi:actin-related protein 9